MSFDHERLYALLPALYRIRDEAQGGPLRALFGVLAEQVAALEENLDQLYDDQFIETCAEWVVPYIGELVGTRGLDPLPNAPFSQRGQVANTLGYRRRKGTAVVLEQLARDVTGWDANAVEFFRLLVTTQHMNHIRPENAAFPDLRDLDRLETLSTPYNSHAHTVDARRIARRRGKYNIPNVGIFLWRLSAVSVTDAPAPPVDASRFHFHPLGVETPLFPRPSGEERFSRLAQPLDVPMPIRSRLLNRHREDYYGAGKSILISVGGVPVPEAQLVICDLADTGADWGFTPQNDLTAIDPIRGRLVLAANAPDPPDVRVTFFYGFSRDMGGGEYGRAATFTSGPASAARVPASHASIQAALDSLNGAGGVEITDNERYEETLAIQAATGERIELRAADLRGPTVILGGDLTITGGDAAEVVLNGLRIAGGSVRVTGDLRRLCLRHCTLLPNAAAPSLIVEAANAEVEIESCILGGIRAVETAEVEIRNSIVDSTAETGVAFAAPDDVGSGPPLTVVNSTLIGKVHAQRIELASNAIFLARLAPADAPAWQAPVWADERQQGCARFSYVPPGSRVPRCFECQPTNAAADARVRPQFTALRYGDPGYCQLSERCAVEIREGADDRAEMGAFHDLFQPQREAHLRARLDEYLRFGLEAGIFYAS